MDRRLLGSLLCWLVILSVPVEAQTLRAGAAMRNITPEPLLPISGGVGPGTPSQTKAGRVIRTSSGAAAR